MRGDPKPIDRDQLISVLRMYMPKESPSVLIVEDDLDTRDVLRRNLAAEGWSTAEAVNGLEGLRQLEKNLPSLILLDLMMPEMDGFQFLALLRQNPQWNAVPVLVLTAMELTQADRERLNGIVEQVLHKGSYRIEVLASEIRRAIYAGKKVRNAKTVASGR